MQFGGPVFFIEALITALAPAIFEEVLFRGIFIYNLKENGCGRLVYSVCCWQLRQSILSSL